MYKDEYDIASEKLVQEIRVLAQCDDVRPIPGHWGYYTTPWGEVWSIRGHGIQKVAKQPRKINARDYKGTRLVKISDDNSMQSTLSLLRVVALAFIGEPSIENAQASPINGDALDIRPENIEWVTPSARTHKMVKRRGPTVYGEKQGLSKLTDEDVLEMRELARQGVSTSELASKMGVTERVARRAVKGQSWKHLDGAFNYKRRFPRGEQISRAKLSESAVIAIRNRYRQGTTLTKLAQEYGVGVSNIWQVVNRETWKHI